MKKVIGFLFVTVFAVFAFAQVMPPEPGSAEWSTWFADLLSGKSGLALGIVAVQGIMLALRSKMGEQAGKWRYFAVVTFSLIVAIAGVFAAGKTWADVAADGAVVAAFSVFLHQAIIQFGTKAGDEVEKTPLKINT